MAEPSELNLWARQWRDERIQQARADLRRRSLAFEGLTDKTTEYARSIQAVREVCAQVLAVWEASPVDLPDGVMDTRTCSCHPDDNPPKPCPRKFSLNECRAAAGMTPCQTEQECEVPALCKETGGCERMEAVCSRGCPSTEVCKAIRSGGECTRGVAIPLEGRDG